MCIRPMVLNENAPVMFTAEGPSINNRTHEKKVKLVS